MKEIQQTKYALITPVRDEEQFIGPMMKSILAQIVLPSKWVIIDDGSLDKTPEIIAEFAKEHDFIDFVRLPAREHRMPGGEGAIAQGMKRLQLSEYDFLARFDSDLVFSAEYIVRILGEFQRDGRLGIAGGGLYVETKAGMKLEEVPDYHVRGALKMYRRECFEQIGGLTSKIGWDTIDEVSAWSKGWNTRSFFQYRVIHCRPTGDGLHASRIYRERGKAEYYTWSLPLFVAIKAAKIGIVKFSPVKAVSFLAGFVKCYLTREPRLQDEDFVKVRRKQQWQRMTGRSNKFLPSEFSNKVQSLQGSL